MLTEEQIAEGWADATTLDAMIGRPIIYRNVDALPVVQLEAWFDGIDEGWAVVEFSDGGRATVRPSRIIAYRKEFPDAR